MINLKKFEIFKTESYNPAEMEIDHFTDFAQQNGINDLQDLPGSRDQMDPDTLKTKFLAEIGTGFMSLDHKKQLNILADYVFNNFDIITGQRLKERNIREFPDEVFAFVESVSGIKMIDDPDAYRDFQAAFIAKQK